MSPAAGSSDACKKCGSVRLVDYNTPPWYKKRVVLCLDCDKVSVLTPVLITATKGRTSKSKLS